MSPHFRVEKHHRNASERAKVADREQVRDAVRSVRPALRSAATYTTLIHDVAVEDIDDPRTPRTC